MSRPRVFIGSSSEGLKVARYLHSALTKFPIEPILWEHGVFGPSRTYIHSLITETKKSNFAVLVFSPDDIVIKRSKKSYAPRDNVLFEMGLFIGGIGLERTYMLVSRGDRIDIASDLAGLSSIQYTKPSNENDASSWKGALAPAALEINDAIHQHGEDEINLHPSNQDLKDHKDDADSVSNILDDVIIHRESPKLNTNDLERFFRLQTITSAKFTKLRRILSNKK